MPWPNQKLTSPISVAKKPKQSRSCTTAEEALDPDANYTEYKGDFETMAARYLCTHDYTILARNYRTPFGEVDLIAQKDGVLVYVEVKYRSSNDYGDPLEAVDRRKQRQICKVANYHYAGYAAGQEMDCRFDVIGIYGDGSIRHIPNAFYFQR